MDNLNENETQENHQNTEIDTVPKQAAQNDTASDIQSADDVPQDDTGQKASKNDDGAEDSDEDVKSIIESKMFGILAPGVNSDGIYQDNEDTTRTLSGDTKKRFDNSTKRKENPREPTQNADTNDELTLENGISLCKRKMSSLRVRMVFSLVLSLISAYLTVAPTYSFFMPKAISYMQSPFIYLLILLILQGICALLSADVIADSLVGIAKGRFGFQFLAAISSTVIFIHGVSIIAFPSWGGFLPYCCVACFMLLFTLYGEYLKYSVIRKAIKVMLISDNPLCVFVEKKPDGVCRAYKAQYDKTELLLKKIKDAIENDGFGGRAAPVIMLCSFIFAVLSCMVSGSAEKFLWTFASIISVSVPFVAAFACNLTEKGAASALFTKGAALTGRGSVSALKRCKEAVVIDSDVFPQGSVDINGLKVISGNDFEKTLCYTSSIIDEAGIGFKTAFSALTKQQFIQNVPVSRLIHHEGGGVSGEINNTPILAGTPGFLMSKGVKVREGLDIKHGVFMAAGEKLTGIFALKYAVNPSAAYSFKLMSKCRISPVLAVRDFNITPGMVEKRFKLRHGETVYPDVDERLCLSERLAPLDTIPCAVVPSGGIRSFAEVLSAGKRVSKILKLDMAMICISSLVGALLMFFLTSSFKYIAAIPHNALLYNFLWIIPALIISLRAGKN